MTLKSFTAYIYAFIFSACFFLLLSNPTQLQAMEIQSTAASHAYIVDVETGDVLLNKKAQERMPTSSMSKVMTMYMVFEALKDGRLSLQDELKVSEKAWRKGGSKMFVEVDKKVSVEDLIRGVVIQSGNDASIVLAEGLSGSEESFAASMTRKAKQLGMMNSNFTNATGWPDPNHYSTPEDLFILSNALLKNFPEYYHYYSETEFTFNGIRQPNRNPLLQSRIGADGIKTGHTEIAGFGLIGSGKRNGRRIIMVINGLDSVKERATEAKRLMEWALDSFENKTLFKAGQKVAEASITLGEEESVSLQVNETVHMTIPKLQRDKVDIKIRFNEPLIAPVKTDVAIGTLSISLPGGTRREYDLFPSQDVKEAGFIRKTFEKLILMMD
jgi:D-alanyl-D-alanine carboxypeptidase (penicillin-binding protein 5/6)